MAQTELNLAPGARILVRDAEWLIRRVDNTSTGGHALNVTGISELVRGKEAIFLTEIDDNRQQFGTRIEVMDPKDTRLVVDSSSAYKSALLYMESLLRRKAPTDRGLHIGHRAAMDLVPYQLDPAIQALDQPRQRILIADAVGLGKTLEAGILMSELIRRGKGKRILVLAVKSMLTQFQKEMWARFSIPLTRLDSVGLQRIRSRIPTNHNPFYYYDKSIISIDTLKNDREYRIYIEEAYWDIIVIDEAHNVAERGSGQTLRARLAKLLSDRSDTLIMLSATPHDGKARSFASLMNMLNPTAIANPDKYTSDEIKGLYIRRFKKDIKEQVATAFMEREVRIERFDASLAEEQVFDTFASMSFSALRNTRTGGMLFKIGLEKSLFSSPAACIMSIRNRIAKLKTGGTDGSNETAGTIHDSDAGYDAETLPSTESDRDSGTVVTTRHEAALRDTALLEGLAGELKELSIDDYTKYQRLLQLIKDKKTGFGWTGRDTTDRLVIFTERIETMKFLAESLQRDLGLREGALATLSGSDARLSDIDMQRIVEDFGKESSPIRLLIATDVASEGINLHYLCHRLVHFDIPWSLMVFQQRNGRIDRYGQEKTPQIAYLVTQSENPRIKGDMRILELLIEKDRQVSENIGDESSFFGVYDQEQEETITARAIEEGKSPEEFEAGIAHRVGDDFDFLAELLGVDDQPKGENSMDETRESESLFKNDYEYCREALDHLRRKMRLQVDFYHDQRRIDLAMPEELKHRFDYLPSEISPDDNLLILSADKVAVMKEIARCRKEEKAWPLIHYLWPLNPVVEWLNDKVTAAFGRHEAPVVKLKGKLAPGETVFVISGLIPNRKGHPLVHEWFGAKFRDGHFEGIEPFADLLSRTGLGRREFPNTGSDDDTAPLQTMLPRAVDEAKTWMSSKRTEFERGINEKLQVELDELDRLKGRQVEQMTLKIESSKRTEGQKESIMGKEKRSIDKLFNGFMDWVQETMTTEDNPFIQVISVLRG